MSLARLGDGEERVRHAKTHPVSPQIAINSKSRNALYALDSKRPIRARFRPCRARRQIKNTVDHSCAKCSHTRQTANVIVDCEMSATKIKETMSRVVHFRHRNTLVRIGDSAPRCPLVSSRVQNLLKICLICCAHLAINNRPVKLKKALTDWGFWPQRWCLVAKVFFHFQRMGLQRRGAARRSWQIPDTRNESAE